MSVLVERIIKAHGGRKRWLGVEQVLATASLTGLEFASRLQGQPLQGVEVAASAGEPRVTLSPFPEAGQVGVFHPSQARIQRDDGEVVASRSAPGAVFRSMRHWFWWDRLDVLYYTGMLLWQNLCLPFTLLRSGCRFEELEPVEAAGGEGTWQRLRVVYPADIPSFAPEQVFYADSTGLVRRIDYAPALYGSWFRVAQFMDSFESASGLVFAQERKAYPCLPNSHAVRLVPFSVLSLSDVTVAGAPPPRPQRRKPSQTA